MLLLHTLCSELDCAIGKMKTEMLLSTAIYCIILGLCMGGFRWIFDPPVNVLAGFGLGGYAGLCGRVAAGNDDLCKEHRLGP